MRREIKFQVTVVVDAPEGSVVDVGLATVDDAPTGGAIGSMPPTSPAKEVEGPVSTSRFATFERDYIARVGEELGIVTALPDSERRREEYLNFYPPPEYGKRRASGLGIK